MKQFYVLIFFTLFSKTVFSQRIDINLISPIAETIQLCDSADSFIVHVSNTDTDGVAMYLQRVPIDFSSLRPSYMTYTTMTIDSINYTVFYVRHDSIHHAPFSFSFKIETCGIVNQMISNNNRLSRSPFDSLPHIMTNGQDTIISFLLNLNDSTPLSDSLFFGTSLINGDTILFTTIFPLFDPPIINPSHTDSANDGEHIVRSLLYINKGTLPNGDFANSFSFSDSYNCPAIRIDSIVVLAGSCNPITVFPYTPDSVISVSIDTLGVVTSYDDSTVHLAASSIQFLEYISIVGCLEKCDSGCTDVDCISHCGNVSNFDFQWGCTPTQICKTLEDCKKIDRGDARPLLEYSRTRPLAEAINADGVWENNCPKDSTSDISHWIFKIWNGGNAPLYHARILLNNPVQLPDHYYVYLINPTTTADSIYFTSNHPVTLFGDTARSLTFPTSNTTPECFIHDSTLNPLSSYVRYISVLNQGDTVTLHFSLLRCCPSDTFLFNNQIIFNSWRLSIAGHDECSDSVSSFNVTANPFRSDSDSLYYPSLSASAGVRLYQTSFPAISDLAGRTDSPYCVPNSHYPLSVENTSLTGVDFNPFVFANTYNNNTDSMYLHGQMKVHFDMDANLKLYVVDRNNVLDSTITISNGVNSGFFTWRPDSVTISPDFCTGGHNTYTAWFNLDSVPLVYRPSTNHSLKNFQRFFIGSSTNFSVYPCCCTAQSSSECRVQTFMNVTSNSCPECFMPLAEDSIPVTTLCPGCHVCGSEINSFSLSRYYQAGNNTFGFKDDDNDSRADIDSIGQPIPIDSGYIATHPLRTFASVSGDLLKSDLSGDFKEGDSLGFTYAEFQSCRHHRLDYLYLEQLIPLSDSLNFLLSVQSCKLTIFPHDSTCVPSGQIVLNIPKGLIIPPHGGASEFFYDLSLAALHDSCGLDTSCYHFMPHDGFHIETIFKECGNLNTGALNDAAVHRSDIDNHLYLSDSTHSYGANYGAHCDAGDYIHDSRYSVCQNLNTSNITTGCFFQCGGFGGKHFFLETQQFIDSLSIIKSGCNWSLRIESYSDFGGTPDKIGLSTFNLFPYEFRPSPVPDSILVRVPSGYHLSDGVVISKFYTFNDSVPCTGHPYASHLSFLFSPYGSIFGNSVCNNVTCAADTLHYTDSVFFHHSYQYETDDTLMDFCDGCDSRLKHCGQGLIHGDENFHQTLLLTISPTNNCSPDTTVIDSFIVRQYFPPIKCADGERTIYANNYQNSKLILPNPHLVLSNPSLVVTDSTGSVCWTVSLSNTHGTGPNVFLYPHQTIDFVVDTITGSASCPCTKDSLGFYHLGELDSGHACTYQICGHENRCAAGRDSALIYFGWSCKPAITSLATACGIDSSWLGYREDSAVLITQLTGSFISCDTSRLIVGIQSPGAGDVRHISVDISSASGLTLDSTNYDLTHQSVLFTGTKPALAGHHLSLDSLDNNLFAADGRTGLQNNELLELTFKFISTCSYHDTIPPAITIHAIKFCGDTLTYHVQGSWHYSGINHCFTLSTDTVHTSCGGGCTGTATVHVIGGSAPHSYLWFNADTDSVETSLCVGTYTVTVTGSGGCSLASTVTISGDSSCCAGGSPGYELSHPNGIIPRGTYLNLHKSLNTSVSVVATSSPVIFDNLDLLVAPGVSITVASDATLIIKSSSDLRACDEMWRGIVAETGATVIVKSNSIIEDAQYAIEAHNQSNITADHAYFTNDYIGIYVPHAVSGLNIIYATINACRFTCLYSLANPYSGQSPIPGLKSYAGIQVNDLTLLNVAPNNFFDHLNNGIDAFNSTVTMKRGTFKAIQRWDGYGSGIGISARSRSHITYTGFGNSTVDFDSCVTGVYGSYSDVTVKNARMTKVRTGIGVRHGTYRYVHLDNNNISATLTAVNLQMNDYSQETSVTNNTIATPSTNLANFNGVAIWDAQIGNINSSISSNVITMGRGNNIGIAAIYARTYHISENNVYLSRTPTTDATAMAFGGNVRDTVNCNIIKGYDANWRNSGQASLYSGLSSYYYYKCDSTDSTFDGFRFQGYSVGTIESNKFNHHHNALYVDSSGTIGIDSLGGNLWYVSDYSPGWGAFDLNPLDKFYFRLSSGRNVPYPINPTSLFFGLSIGTEAICGPTDCQ